MKVAVLPVVLFCLDLGVLLVGAKHVKFEGKLPTGVSPLVAGR